jgi:hypothetical protein
VGILLNYIVCFLITFTAFVQIQYLNVVFRCFLNFVIFLTLNMWGSTAFVLLINLRSWVYSLHLIEHDNLPFLAFVRFRLNCVVCLRVVDHDFLSYSTFVSFQHFCVTSLSLFSNPSTTSCWNCHHFLPSFRMLSHFCADYLSVVVNVFFSFSTFVRFYLFCVAYTSSFSIPFS